MPAIGPRRQARQQRIQRRAARRRPGPVRPARGGRCSRRAGRSARCGRDRDRTGDTESRCPASAACRTPPSRDSPTRSRSARSCRRRRDCPTRHAPCPSARARSGAFSASASASTWSMRTHAAGAAEQRDLARLAQPRGQPLDRIRRRHGDRARRAAVRPASAAVPRAAGRSATSPGITSTATARCVTAWRIAISSARGICSALATSSQYELHSRNRDSGMRFLEIS